ncbi:WecB/TagA/CpsF family glycosyltransferase [Pseudoalteromonas distincta]|uniref:WecB/TagA/CpsF family glycosyltransferase n=1 Tax=Pseudoalteromonas distincta TaxID=77608 RepID=UPI00241EB552|nr:WecB/TagA/CpsF family glycosyltransferase [Pseudoalteromonas distincta]|tara:strand:+ start:100425 stop:101138 length:714 start_codon:yes stop_codon:yes gene_type:complete
MTKVFKVISKKINIYETKNDALEAITKSKSKKNVLSFVNAHAFNLANKNNDFFISLNSFKYVLRDGIGVKILLKCLGKEPGENLNGTDFIPSLLESYGKNKTIAIWGTKVEVIEKAIPEIELLGCKVVHYKDGFLNVNDYIKFSKHVNADIYLLAMGMPKQEVLAKALYEEIDSGLIICGGAIVDFMSGTIRRAPKIFRVTGLEWLYRLFKEPKRLFRRYVFGNVVFLINAIKAKSD